MKIFCDRNKSALEKTNRNYHDNIKLNDSFDALLYEEGNSFSPETGQAA